MASLVLLALDKLPLFTDLNVAVSRVIIVSFPASLGAVIIDSLDKE